MKRIITTTKQIKILFDEAEDISKYTQSLKERGFIMVNRAPWKDSFGDYWIMEVYERTVSG